MSGWSLAPLFFVVQLLVAVGMLAAKLPRRPLSVGRCAGLAALVCAIYALPRLNELFQPLGGEALPLSTLLSFCSALVASVFAIRLAFVVGPWPALFCATAGYTMQNLASGMERLWLDLIPSLGPLPAHLLSPLLVYVVCYLVFVRKIRGESLRLVGDRPMLAMFVVVSLAVIGFDLVVKETTAEGISTQNAVLLRLAHSLVCVFVLFAEYEILYVSQLRSEGLALTHMLAERERQYEHAKDTIEQINVKCHDIRHWIRHYESLPSALPVDPQTLEDIAREVNVYDAAVKTGDDTLDVILTEKSLLCEREGISLSCVVDGPSLGFMRPADLYALFGNALDNAIEAAREETLGERRAISLNVRRHGELVAIGVDNYVSRTVEFSGGLPVTTKEDAAQHGFGMRSMRLIAERYGGSLQASVEEGVFSLSVLIPLPAAPQGE